MIKENEILQTEFKNRGFQFRQLKRDGNIALYEKRDGASRSYEIIKIRSKEENKTIIEGRKITFKGGEYYPSDSEWGDFGWSFMELRNALSEYQAYVG